MANGLERMLANIGASNIREQQREERMSSNILNQAFRQEQERVKDGTDILKNLNAQIQGLSDPSQIDSVRSTAQSIVNQIDNPVTSSIMGLIDNSVNLQKQKINVERKEKAIVQQFDSKLKNVKSQSDLNALKLDIATMETGDLKDDLSKRLQGISTSITEIQTQNASDFLMQDNAGLLFNPERFTDVQKDSVLKQSNVFKRYDKNDKLEPQEEKLLLLMNNALRRKASGDDSADTDITNYQNEYIELQYPTDATPTSGVFIGGNQIATNDEYKSDVSEVVQKLRNIKGNFDDLSISNKSFVNDINIQGFNETYSKSPVVFMNRVESEILKNVNSFFPSSFFTTLEKKEESDRSIFNDKIGVSDYIFLNNGSDVGYIPNVTTYGDVKDLWIVENEFGSFYKAPVLRQALKKAKQNKEASENMGEFIRKNVDSGTVIRRKGEGRIDKIFNYLDTSLSTYDSLLPVTNKYKNPNDQEISFISEAIDLSPQQSLVDD